MDGDINKIEVRLSESESESVMYQDDVYDGTYENEIFLVKVRLVVMNWHVCTEKLRVRYWVKSSQSEISMGM